jgi:hypothetical protein
VTGSVTPTNQLDSQIQIGLSDAAIDTSQRRFVNGFRGFVTRRPGEILAGSSASTASASEQFIWDEWLEVG